MGPHWAAENHFGPIAGGIMSRTEAVEQYMNAQKQGKKYYFACVSKGQYPYPQVLDELIRDVPTTPVKVGLVDIPSDRIVGTWASGRKAAFAGNFMPLLDIGTEFGSKWVSLCEAHLDESGITDPITCFEYLGKFYVQEGHKRVSVLRSFDSPSITGIVTRLVPPLTDDPEVQIYYEFLRFYKVSQLYLVTFSQSGSYARLQAALGYDPDQEWTGEARRSFIATFRDFMSAFDRLNSADKLPLTAGDALLAYLKVHPYSEMQHQTTDQISASLTELWPDVQLLAQGEPISVSTEPEEKEKSILSRILGGPRLHVAFFYAANPKVSPWAAAHEQGQKHLEETLGSSVEISAHLCGENVDEAMETAVTQGANVLFATTPTMIDACRRLAARHKNVAVFNCSLSMPYAGVRSYYCRLYEGKFISGAIAGAMANEDRIGYVANYPIMGVPSAINAFALGARLTNPRVQISLKWSCLPGNPILEFKNDGITVISNRDEDGSLSGLSWDLGTYAVTPEGGLMSLVSPRWNWGSYYEKTVRSLLNGGVEALRDSKHAINDWWGISTGVVSVDIAPEMPDSMKRLASILKNGIIKEEIDPFLCPIRDQQGRVVSDGSRRFTLEELMRMDWLCDAIDGSIPAFDTLLPQSRNLVRLLGIYRESIPPEPEDPAV